MIYIIVITDFFLLVKLYHFSNNNKVGETILRGNAMINILATLRTLLNIIAVLGLKTVLCFTACIPKQTPT